MMEKTTVGRYEDVILTAGMINATTGRRLFGVFASEEDARSMNADALAMATCSADNLSAEQVAMAERNSEAL